MNVLLSATLVVLSLLLTAVSGQLTQADKDAILAEHNSFRSSVDPIATNMLRLVWSDELATVAQNYSGRCMFAFNPDRVSQQSTFATVGENLSFEFTDNETLDYTTQVTGWGVQGNDYNYTSNTCEGICGFYTQMIWANSGFVGCGASRCVAGFLFVCNYGPAGNVLGEIPYITGAQSCSACPDGRSVCTDNLCSSAATSVTTSSVVVMVLLCAVIVKIVM